ncbi:recombinase RecA [Loigolactobacillus zhaoyuanensis]|uniref:recombinase RecA n=1 Tax=Loigolactobacillus zhaoyuanensis TaxID=2486017 RepID=UPI000F74B6F1|nr:recombinase RecA [Loigolactobacillus zhaoyuanensis]
MATKHTITPVHEITDSSDRKAALDKALNKITKDFGQGAIMRMGEKASAEVQTISSGITSLDIALGAGGYAKGRIVEVYGPESSGKTTLALAAVADVQKNGGTVAYIDAENAMDPEYAQHLGVNIDELYLSQPGTGEEALQIVDELVRSAALDLIVVDSVAALVPKAEIEGDIGDSHVGLQARLMSQGLRRLAGELNNAKTALIFINQLREKIGVMFGNPETTPGGRALKFYATQRIEVRRGEKIKDGTEIIGNQIKIKVAKNKVAPPFKVALIQNFYGKGFSKTGDTVGLATEADIIQKSGAWYSYNNGHIGQGLTNTINYLDENPAVLSEINAKVRAHYLDEKQPAAPADGSEATAEQTK